MEGSLTLRFKIKLAAATATLALGAVTALAAGSGAAVAATPSCGPACLDVFSKQFGTFHHPGFVLDTFRGGARVGQPVILFQGSNSDPAEDFSIGSPGQPVGHTSDFFAAGLLSAAVELHYGAQQVPADPARQPDLPG